MLKATMLLMLGLRAGMVIAEDLGQLSANPYGPNSTANPYSPAGSPYSSTSVKNPYGTYGSPYSNQSAINPYATDAPKLCDSPPTYTPPVPSYSRPPSSGYQAPSYGTRPTAADPWKVLGDQAGDDSDADDPSGDSGD
jgi:hypothetical protein